MPTYEYRCKDCAHEFTTVLSIGEHDKATPPCPACKSANVEQVFRSVFVQTSRKS